MLPYPTRRIAEVNATTSWRTENGTEEAPVTVVRVQMVEEAGGGAALPDQAVSGANSRAVGAESAVVELLHLGSRVLLLRLVHELVM
jgi:bifunctional ADP-heptose synthase (sugar kinase/adenylyltransferase)